MRRWHEGGRGYKGQYGDGLVLSLRLQEEEEKAMALYGVDEDKEGSWRSGEGVAVPHGQSCFAKRRDISARQVGIQSGPLVQGRAVPAGFGRGPLDCWLLHWLVHGSASNDSPQSIPLQYERWMAEQNAAENGIADAGNTAHQDG